MASNANLVISITAKDTTTGAFKRVKANLGDLEKSSGDLGDSCLLYTSPSPRD